LAIRQEQGGSKTAMSGFEWRRVPIGLDARRWVTRDDFSTVLVIVHTVTSGQRLLDVVHLLESDLRLQVVFTRGPDVFNHGVEQFLTDVGGVVVPWQQATELEFELAIAASYGGIDAVHAPLIVMPHGAGFGKMVGRAGQAVGGGVAYGLDPQRLIRDGRVVPDALVLPHEAERARLARTCPEALPVAEIVGDPCHDRIVASLPFREVYRRALGVQQGQKLVVVTSTWGPRSLFGARDNLISRLMRDLPRDEYRVLAVLHPNVWTGHGTWQVRAWLADHLRNGLSLMPPEAEWRAAIVAADWIIGDHGSVALYGTVAGVPVLRTDIPVKEIDPASAIPEFAKITPRVSSHRSMLTQLSKALTEYDADRYQKVIARITSEPGKFNRNMRRLMYRLIGLRQPASIPTTDPVSPSFLYE
jgi:hypothetical protein